MSLKASLVDELQQIEARLVWLAQEWQRVHDREQQVRGGLDVVALILPLSATADPGQEESS